MTAPLRPTAGEFASFYQRYIDGIKDGELMEQLEGQPDQLEQLLGKLSVEQAGYRYAKGKWSIRQVVGHLTDTERVMTYRMLRISRGDSTPLPGFDENMYVDAATFDTQSLRTLLDSVRRMRATTMDLVASIDDAGWARLGSANNAAISARALAWIVAGHFAHHVRGLKEHYGV